jgi:transposase
MAERRATDAEIKRRRIQVLRLRFAQLSEPEIAERLGVSASTISRDLQAVHDGWVCLEAEADSGAAAKVK